MDPIQAQWVRDFSVSFNGLWNYTWRICQEDCISSQSYWVPSLPLCKTSCSEACHQTGLSDTEEITVADSNWRRALLEHRGVTWQGCESSCCSWLVANGWGWPAAASTQSQSWRKPTAKCCVQDFAARNVRVKLVACLSIFLGWRNLGEVTFEWDSLMTRLHIAHGRAGKRAFLHCLL